MDQYKIDFKAMAWKSPAAGVKFKAYEEGGSKLRLVEFGREFVEHDWCAKGHIGHILEGQIEIDFDGRAIAFGPGDGVSIPAGEKHKHKARVLTDVVKAILVEDV